MHHNPSPESHTLSVSQYLSVSHSHCTVSHSLPVSLFLSLSPTLTLPPTLLYFNIFFFISVFLSLTLSLTPRSFPSISHFLTSISLFLLNWRFLPIPLSQRIIIRHWLPLCRHLLPFVHGRRRVRANGPLIVLPQYRLLCGLYRRPVAEIKCERRQLFRGWYFKWNCKIEVWMGQGERIN